MSEYENFSLLLWHRAIQHANWLLTLLLVVVFPVQAERYQQQKWQIWRGL